MYLFNRSVIVILFVHGLASCSTPGPRTLADTTPEKTGGQLLVDWDWTQHEDFNPEPYQEQLAGPASMIQHDIPNVLLSDDSLLFDTSDMQSGFRVQILSTLHKLEADQIIEDALAWWQDFVEDTSFYQLYPQFESKPPIYQDFRAPYYRIRIGNFLHRDDAERFLETVEKSYASAFIAPDMVIIGTPTE